MDWTGFLDVGLRAILGYAVLLLIVRFSGNRTLAKLRAFDLVVTIALGSLLATAVTDRDAPISHVLLAVACLVALQWLVAALSARSERFNRLVTSRSILLYEGGAFDRKALRRARVTPEQVEGAARQAGHVGMATVAGAWLEENGSISIVPHRSVAAGPREEA